MDRAELTIPCPPNPLSLARVSRYRLLLVTTSLLSIVGCSNLVQPRPFRTNPTFLAYWTEGSGPGGCRLEEDEDDPCVAFRSSLSELQVLAQVWHEERSLELVDFDAHVTRAGAVYAGAWAADDRPHTLRGDLRWNGFRRLHRRLAREGQELLHLRVYEDESRPRVAGIWRSGNGEDSAPTRVSHNRDWNRLRKEDDQQRKRGFHLAEIEVYPRPDSPDDRWTAGVWRAGEMKTRLLHDLRCDRSREPVRNPILSPSGTIEDEYVYDRCELLLEVETMAEQGFQAVDFERYSEGGEERWAVLFHARPGAGWLQFPGDVSSMTLRERRLDAGSPAAGYDLRDLDLLSISTRFLDDDPTHQGVIHDGGTAGPP